MCFRNALRPCGTSWVEKAACGAAVPPAESSLGRGQAEEPEQSSSWHFQHLQWWFSHPFSLSGHCNCRHGIQEDVLQEASRLCCLEVALFGCDRGRCSSVMLNTQDSPGLTLYHISLFFSSGLPQGILFPHNPSKTYWHHCWGQWWALGAVISQREAGRWNEEVLWARLGNVACPSIALRRNTLDWPWGELWRKHSLGGGFVPVKQRQ